MVINYVETGLMERVHPADREKVRDMIYLLVLGKVNFIEAHNFLVGYGVYLTEDGRLLCY